VASSFWVNVDPTNPGQFFACCGLLELADRLWPVAEGWFESTGRLFHLACGGHTLHELLTALANLQVEIVSHFVPSGIEIQERIRPLNLVFPTNPPSSMQIDAWVELAMVKGIAKDRATPWNFWSGNQKSFGIWNSLRAALAGQLKFGDLSNSAAPFSHRLFQGGRFGFDCGPAWNALDVGFSPNEQNMEVKSSPLVELLAAIGLQRFRPVMNEHRDGFDYFSWHHPFSPNVAAAAMAGAIRERTTQRFRASVVSRGQYAALSKAFSINSGDSDD
jgi:CRISPR-associated protein Csx14